jgi:Lon protease-like protein
VPLLPLFPLEIVLFPGAPLPLHIFEPRYKEMIGECLEQKRPFGMVRLKENSLAAVGCSATILDVVKKYDDGRLDIAAQGRQRFEIESLNHERSFLQGEISYFDDEPSEIEGTHRQELIQLHEQLFSILGQTPEVQPDAPSISFFLANELPVDLDFKQTLLEMKTEAERIETLTEYYRATIPKVQQTLLARERAGRNGHAR